MNTKFTFDAKGYSTTGLLMLHNSIYKAVQSDKINPEKNDPYYGVYEHKDWKIQSDAFEAELSKRDEDFDPIDWSS